MEFVLPEVSQTAIPSVEMLNRSTYESLAGTCSRRGDRTTDLPHRGHKVMLDRDLASLYGIKPIRLREQVKRNRSRFPDDFHVPVDGEGNGGLAIAECDTLKKTPGRVPTLCFH